MGGFSIERAVEERFSVGEWPSPRKHAERRGRSRAEDVARRERRREREEEGRRREEAAAGLISNATLPGKGKRHDGYMHCEGGGVDGERKYGV